MTSTIDNQKQHGHRQILILGVALLLQFAATLLQAETATPIPDPVVLESSPRHYQIAQLVTKLSERAHYTKTRIDNDLSVILLDNYLEGLDSNRSFFLQADIDNFQRYRYSYDNALRSGEMEPVFDIFKVYRERAKENYEYEYEDDIPEGDETSEAWPYGSEFDEVWQHKFTEAT